MNIANFKVCLNLGHGQTGRHVDTNCHFVANTLRYCKEAPVGFGTSVRVLANDSRAAGYIYIAFDNVESR
jgi:hypothetical protein